MTDTILLALILVFAALHWAEHSLWLADKRRVGRKWKAKMGKRIKNWKHRRRMKHG